MKNVKKLSVEQAVVVSAYTGFLCVEFGVMHAAIEAKLGRAVWTHELAFIMPTEVRNAFKEDFLALVPRLGGNLSTESKR